MALGSNGSGPPGGILVGGSWARAALTPPKAKSALNNARAAKPNSRFDFAQGIWCSVSRPKAQICNAAVARLSPSDHLKVPFRYSNQISWLNGNRSCQGVFLPNVLTG